MRCAGTEYEEGTADDMSKKKYVVRLTEEEQRVRLRTLIGRRTAPRRAR